MNERIKELAKQAGFLNKDEESIEYFAELIVKECVQTLLDNTPEQSAEEDWDKGYDRAMRDCVHHIKEHFGVE
jgi:hypothetical protein